MLGDAQGLLGKSARRRRGAVDELVAVDELDMKMIGATLFQGSQDQLFQVRARRHHFDTVFDASILDLAASIFVKSLSRNFTTDTARH